MLTYLSNYEKKAVVRHKDVKLLCFLLCQPAAVTVQEINDAHVVDRASTRKYLSNLIQLGLVTTNTSFTPQVYSITKRGINLLDNLTQ